MPHLKPVPVKVTAPCVNMNGTSKQDLLKQQTDIMDAADVLIAALRAATRLLSAR